MKKKVMIGICVLLAIVLLVPIPMRLKDGGLNRESGQTYFFIIAWLVSLVHGSAIFISLLS